jgi:hypothetical protein
VCWKRNSKSNGVVGRKWKYLEVVATVTLGREGAGVWRGKVQQAAAKSSSLRCVVLMEKNRRKKKKSKGRERLAGPPGWAVNWAELR